MGEVGLGCCSEQECAGADQWVAALRLRARFGHWKSAGIGMGDPSHNENRGEMERPMGQPGAV